MHLRSRLSATGGQAAFAALPRLAGLAALAIAVAAVIAGCASLKQIGAGEHNPAAKSFTVTPRVTTVVIDGGSGSIDVTGADRATVAVSQQATYSKTPPSVAHAMHGNTLTLSYTCPTEFVCGVSYVIQVPRGVTVQARTSAGSITLTSLAGPVTASTDAGLITAVDLYSPTANFKSDAGGVIVTFSTAPATIDASTNIGSIALTMPGDTAYRIKTHTLLGASTITVRKSAASSHSITASSDVGSISISPS